MSQETDQLILTLSHSQASIWNSCEMKWKYNYQDQLVPVIPRASYQLGTLFHELTAVYDQLVMTGLPVGDPYTWERVSEYSEEEFFKETDITDQIELYNVATRSAKRYILEHSRNHDLGVKVIGVEDEFNLELTTPKGRTFKLNGFIDRLHTEGGRFWILDRKTSKTGKHYTENELLMDPQLLLYDAVYSYLGRPVFGVAIDSVSTYPYNNYMGQPISKVMKRLYSYHTEEQKKFVFLYYGQIADSIYDKLESGEEFRRSLSRDCVRCQYMEPCAYAQKGIDPSYLLAANFELKQPRRDRARLLLAERAKETDTSQ